MSYYDSTFDLKFKRKFSKSYAAFSDNELNSIALKIMMDLISVPNDIDNKFMHISRYKKQLEDVVANGLSFYRDYGPSYQRLLRSNKILHLFDSSFEIKTLPDVEAKKSHVYYRQREEDLQKEARRYARFENIPVEFALMSLEDDCIKNLIGFFLKKHIGISFNAAILNSCKRNSKLWLRNENLETPYQRTGHFQKYLHFICREYKGTELDISPKLMRIILSTARLHFSIMDEQYLTLDNLSLILDKQASFANKEDEMGLSYYQNGDSVSNMMGKKYIKNWRKRHLMPFLYKSEKFDYIANLDSSDPLVDLKLVLLDSHFGGIDLIA